MNPTTRSRQRSLTVLALLAALVAAVLTAFVPSATANTPGSSATVPAHFRSTAAYFTNRSHGWVLGDAQCSHRASVHCPSIIRTVDGGAHWTSVHAPAGLTSTRDFGSCEDNGTVHGPCVNRILFADADHGYVWSLHSLYWTTNGGRTWQHLLQTHSHPWVGATALRRVGDYVLRMMPVAQCSAGCVGRLMRSRIGSGAWHSVTPARSGLYTSGLDAQGSTVYFLSGSSADGPGRGLFRSTDFGAHWSRIASYPCGLGRGSGVSFSRLASFDVTPDGAITIQCYTRHPSVKVKAAGQAHFSSSRRLPPGYDLYGAWSAKRFGALKWLNDANVARLAVSNSGGRDWNIRGKVHLSGIVSAGRHLGYALVGNGTALLLTTDSGHTWTRHAF